VARHVGLPVDTSRDQANGVVTRRPRSVTFSVQLLARDLVILPKAGTNHHYLEGLVDQAPLHAVWNLVVVVV
jgi:hypothetical protein